MKTLICALAAALISGGASLDAMTRMVADKMQAALGQNLIVENRTGAAGRIAALNAPGVRERLNNYGLEPTGLPPAELARIHRRDCGQWGPVIKASGFKAGS